MAQAGGVLEEVQFKDFGDFADREMKKNAKGHSVARLGSYLVSTNRSKKAAAVDVDPSMFRDSVSSLCRSSKTKSVNNGVRGSFLVSVLRECGVRRVGDLPAGVQAALELDKIGVTAECTIEDLRDGTVRATGGEPLTAFAISQVKTAILNARDEVLSGVFMKSSGETGGTAAIAVVNGLKATPTGRDAISRMMDGGAGDRVTLRTRTGVPVSYRLSDYVNSASGLPPFEALLQDHLEKSGLSSLAGDPVKNAARMFGFTTDGADRLNGLAAEDAAARLREHFDGGGCLLVSRNGQTLTVTAVDDGVSSPVLQTVDPRTGEAGETLLLDDMLGGANGSLVFLDPPLTTEQRAGIVQKAMAKIPDGADGIERELLKILAERKSNLRSEFCGAAGNLELERLARLEAAPTGGGREAGPSKPSLKLMGDDCPPELMAKMRRTLRDDGVAFDYVDALFDEAFAEFERQGSGLDGSMKVLNADSRLRDLRDEADRLVSEYRSVTDKARRMPGKFSLADEISAAQGNLLKGLAQAFRRSVPQAAGIDMDKFDMAVKLGVQNARAQKGAEVRISKVAEEVVARLGKFLPAEKEVAAAFKEFLNESVKGLDIENLDENGIAKEIEYGD